MKRKEASFEGEAPQVCDTATTGMRLSEAFLASLQKRGLLTRVQIEECRIRLSNFYETDRAK